MNDLTYAQSEKEKKRLLILEIIEFLYLGIMFLLFYLVGFPTWVSIVCVDIVPFVIFMFEFYPVIDLFNKKFMFTYKEGFLFAMALIDLGAYITAMFLLR